MQNSSHSSGQNSTGSSGTHFNTDRGSTSTVNTARIYVWDPLVRIFHWSLVLAFTLSYFTGEEENDIHAYSGYVILALVCIRIVWGLVGSRHARFSDFVRPVSEAVTYLKGILSGNSKDYVGHNPAGGLMVLALLGSLLMTGATGLWVYGLEGHGPLAVTQSEVHYGASSQEHEKYEENDDYDSVTLRGSSEYEAHEHEEHEDEREEFWEEIHEFFANLTVLLIAGHLLGVLVSSLAHGQNLVKAMISGYKERR